MNRKIGLLFSLFLILSCGTQKFSNHIDSQVYQCGKDLVPTAVQRLVPSNLPELVGAAQLPDLAVLRVREGGEEQPVALSRKGCLLLPRTVAKDEILIARKEGLRAELNQDDLITFAPDRTQSFVTIDSPKRQFNSLDSVPINGSRGLLLKACFRALSEAINPCLNAQGLALWDNGSYQDFTAQVANLPTASGDFRLYILARDLFHRVSTFTFDIQINNKLPEIKPDFVSALRAITFEKRSGYAIEESYKMGFVANKPLNELTIRYCIFSGLTGTPPESSRCPESAMKVFDPFAPETLEPGFWEIRSQAQDLAGNLSEWKSSWLLVGHACEAAALDQSPLPFCTHILGSVVSSPLLHEIPTEAFRYVVTVDGRLELTGFTPLTDDEDIFANLHSVGTLALISTSLSNMHLFRNVQQIHDSLEVIFNIHLQDLSGLEQVRTIPRDLLLQDNMELTSLRGLEGLTAIGGKFTASGNTKLDDLGRLHGMRSLRELEIRDNESLTTLGRFDQIQELKSLILDQLPRLRDLSGLPALVSAETVSLQHLDLIQTMEGFPSLKHVRFEMLIQNNPQLASLKGMEGIEYYFPLKILDNKDLKPLFQPAPDHAWASITELEIQRNEKLCTDIAGFFPLPPESMIRTIAGNCRP